MEKLFEEQERLNTKDSDLSLKRFFASHIVSLILWALSILFFIITMVIAFAPISNATYKTKYLSDYMIIEESLYFQGNNKWSAAATSYSVDSDKKNVTHYDGKYEIKKGVLIMENKPFGVCNAFVIKTKTTNYYCYANYFWTIFCSLAFFLCLIFGVFRFHSEKKSELKASKKDDE